MPTVRVYTVKPNRFVPVSEDEFYVYHQTDGALAEGNGETGGLSLSKTYPDRVATYWGNARYLKIKLNGGYDVFSPVDVKKSHGALRPLIPGLNWPKSEARQSFYAFLTLRLCLLKEASKAEAHALGVR